jgi:hypothetical protein
MSKEKYKGKEKNGIGVPLGFFVFEDISHLTPCKVYEHNKVNTGYEHKENHRIVYGWRIVELYAIVFGRKTASRDGSK